MIHHIKRATRHLIFWSLLGLAITLSAARLLMLGINHYKADLATYISELMGAPVTIGHVSARIHGINAEVIVRDIGIASAKTGEKPAIQLEQIRLGINLKTALHSRQLLSSSSVTLVGAKLMVQRKVDGSFGVVGLKANNDSKPLWLLQGRKYQVLQSTITWQDEKRQGKPITFDGVDLAIMNEGNRHRLNMLVDLPKKYGELLRVSADFTGNAFEPDAIQGTVYVEGKHLKLDKLVTGSLPLAVHIDSGVSDFSVWTQVEKSQLVSLQGNVAFQALRLRRAKHDDFAAQALKTQFYWAVQDGQWRLYANDLSLQQGQQNAKSNLVFGLLGTQAQAGAVQKLALHSKHLDLPTLHKAMLFFAPLTEEQNKQLAQTPIKGYLENFGFSGNLLANTYRVDGGFAHVSLSGGEAGLGVENLSGTLKGDAEQGSIQLATENGVFSAPKLFRNPLALYKLHGNLAWLQTDSQWQLSSPLLELNVPAIHSKTRLDIILPKSADAPPFLDIHGEFTGEDVSKVGQYLPVGIMKKTVVDWLDKAFVQGHVSKGGFLFYGSPADFPFARGQGVFEVLFDVDDMTLFYHPDWPQVTGINAEVLFLQNALQVAIRKAQTYQMGITQTLIRIPELGNSPHLLIEGSLDSDIANALAYMQHTPIHAGIDAVLDAIKPSGKTQVALDLKVPLQDSAIAKVQGSAQVEDAKLTIKSIDLPVTHLKGALKFNERGVYSDTIDADALHYPVKINIDQASDKTVINVAGRAAVEDLQQQFPVLNWDKFSGASNYRLRLDLPNGKNTPSLNLQSDLVGMALDLPDSLAKKTPETRPLSLDFDLNSQSLLPVSLAYDSQLKMALKVDIINKTLESANVVLGGKDVSQPTTPGINVDIYRDRLVLQEWLALAASNTVASDAKKAGEVGLKSIRIHARQGLWKDTELGVFDLSLTPEQGYWSGLINSQIAKGKIHVPYQLQGNDKISLNMEQLDFSVLKQIESTNQSSPKPHYVLDTVPEIKPLLAIFSKKTLWQGSDLGQLNIDTERKSDGIAFTRLELANEEHKLSATGDWKITGKQSKTVLKGYWDVPKAGAFFNQIGFTQDFTETQAKVDFSFNWPAAPQQFALAKLNGQLGVHLKRGRILSIEPGFGRVLGVLALAQWVKRLQLDFSDVFQDGLTYNRIDGHFDIVNGKAITKNLVIDAIPATITLSGETDLLKKTVDFKVNVVPNSADAVPIAGTIVGKVTSIVAKTLTGKNQDGFLFGTQYEIKGAWDDVQISQLHQHDGLLQKTWHGLTDFSWLTK